LKSYASIRYGGDVQKIKVGHFVLPQASIRADQARRGYHLRPDWGGQHQQHKDKGKGG